MEHEELRHLDRVLAEMPDLEGGQAEEDGVEAVVLVLPDLLEDEEREPRDERPRDLLPQGLVQVDRSGEDAGRDERRPEDGPAGGPLDAERRRDP